MIGFDKDRKTYFVQVVTKDPISNKRRYIKKRGFKLKRDAIEYESKLNIEKNNGLSSTTPTTFREMVKLWEDNIESTDTARKRHKEHFEYRFSELMDKPIKSITKEMLIQWRTNLSKMDTATSTKNVTINYVRSVFKFAADIYGIQNTSVVLKRLKNTDTDIQKEMEVWTVEEFNQFLACVDNELYQIFFSTLFWTGARRGEVIALQCDDLIEEDKTIYIHGSQKDRKNGIKTTKTGNKRYVRLDDNLYNQLLRLKRFYKTGYLFGGTSACTPTMIDRKFSKGIELSGVKRIRLHDLRHSHATILINAGVSIVAVSKRLGHASINQTLKTYTHLLKDTDDKMISYINEIHRCNK